MPFAKFWCEQTASNVWIAELEVGSPISRFEAMRAETYDDIMAKVDESYRRLTGPSEKEKRKTLEAMTAAEIANLPVTVAMSDHSDPEPDDGYRLMIAQESGRAAAEPADAPDALEAPEAAETATDHQAAPVEPPVRQKRQYRKRAKAV